MSDFGAEMVLREARQRLPLRRLLVEYGHAPKEPEGWKAFTCPHCGKKKAGVFRGRDGAELFKCFSGRCPTMSVAMDEVGYVAYVSRLNRKEAFKTFLKMAGVNDRRPPREKSEDGASDIAVAFSACGKGRTGLSLTTDSNARHVLLAFADVLGLAKAAAMDDLRITVQDTNVILSWPSAGYQVFVVRYRTNLQPESAWVVLTNSYPATPNTNRTQFIHFGAVAPPTGGGGGGGGSGGSPPAPLYVAGLAGPVTATTELGADRPKRPKQARPPDASGRKVEMPPLPPWPPEPWRRQGQANSREITLQSASSWSLTSGTGFYQVILAPDFWFDYSQWEFTEGWEFMPVYLGVPAELLANAELVVDGQRFPWAELAYEEEYNFGTTEHPDIHPTYGMWFNHDRLPNGQHTLQLRTAIHLNNLKVEGTPTLPLTAPAFTSTVNNPISFDLWHDGIVGNSHLFRAKTTLHPANWQLDIYDANGELVTSHTGSTTDGSMAWTWDLRDTSGNLRDDLDYDPFFDPWLTVTATGGSGTEQTRPAPITSVDYPKVGAWLIAYQDSDKRTPETRSTIDAAVQAVRGGPAGANIPNHYVSLAYGKDVHADPATAQVIRNNTWDGFRTYMFNLAYNVRNLYYMGHATGADIGGDFDYETNGVVVFSQNNPDSYLVGNTRVVSTAFLAHTAVLGGITENKEVGPRRYRFAFLDGCASAGGYWPEAFGVGKETNTLAIYQDPSFNVYNWRPSAFVGWQEPIGYCWVRNQRVGDWGDYVQYANFRTEWMTEWSVRARTLIASLTQASQTAGWINSSTLNRVLRAFGYQELRFNDFNRREDWPIH
jgi:hypothetical protein